MRSLRMLINFLHCYDNLSQQITTGNCVKNLEASDEHGTFILSAARDFRLIDLSPLLVLCSVGASVDPVALCICGSVDRRTWSMERTRGVFGGRCQTTSVLFRSLRV